VRFQNPYFLLCRCIDSIPNFDIYIIYTRNCYRACTAENHDRDYFITLKGRWCDIIILNVQASSKDKNDDMKDSIYEELFDQFPVYHTKILLGDFNTKVGRENIFQPTVGTEAYMQKVKIVVLD
jgi:hypothetical protein